MLQKLAVIRPTQACRPVSSAVIVLVLISVLLRGEGGRLARVHSKVSTSDSTLELYLISTIDSPRRSRYLNGFHVLELLGGDRIIASGLTCAGVFLQVNSPIQVAKAQSTRSKRR